MLSVFLVAGLVASNCATGAELKPPPPLRPVNGATPPARTPSGWGAPRGGIWDETQAETIKQNRIKYSNELAAAETKLVDAQKDMMKLWLDAKADEKALRAKAEAVGSAQADLFMLQRTKIFGPVIQTLTPVQRAEMERQMTAAPVNRGVPAQRPGASGDTPPGGGTAPPTTK